MTENKLKEHAEWAKRFTIACGIYVHEMQGENPYEFMFLNPADIIREVDKWPDKGNLFFATLTYGNQAKELELDDDGFIERNLITEEPPTRLLKEATLFKDGGK